jgi:transcription initiation factor TFIID subunit 2
MDFGTISDKIDKKEYDNLDSFAHDIQLVFDNCRIFNPPGTIPVQCVEAIEKSWRSQLAKLKEKKLAAQDKRSLQSLLTRLGKDEYLSVIYKSYI